MATAEAMDTGSLWDGLPNELVAHVFWFLPCTRARVAAMACWRWEALLGGRHDCCVPADHPHGDVGVCEWAAGAGHLHCLAWARALGREWSPPTFSSAVRHGRMDAIVHLRENGCPWDERACEAAARRGRLDILAYLREDGCPWDDRTVVAAAGSKHPKTIAYARAHMCPEP